MNIFITFTFLLIAIPVWSDFEYVRSIGGVVSDIAVYHNKDGDGKTYLYVAQSATILVFDVSDWRNPIKLGCMNPVTTPIKQIEVVGDALAVAVESQGVVLLSLENPQQMKIANRLDDIRGSALQRIGNILMVSGIFSAKSGPASYSISHNFYDASNAFSPEFLLGLGFRPAINWKNPNTYYPSFSKKHSLEFYGLSHGIPPNLLSRYRLSKLDTGEYDVEKVVVAPDTFIRDPNDDNFFIDAAVVDDVGYFLFPDHLISIDLSNPESISKLDSLQFSNPAKDLLYVDDVLYVTHENSCLALDVSKPNSLQISDEYSIPFAQQEIVNGLAFAHTEDKVYIYPLADNLEERTVIRFDAFQACRGVYRNGVLYSGYTKTKTYDLGIESGTTSIVIHRIHDNNEFERVNEIQIPGLFLELRAQDDVLMVVTSEGFHFLDYVDPANPQLRSIFPLHAQYRDSLYTSLTYSVVWRGDYLYLSCSDVNDEKGCLRIVSLIDIDRPTELPSLETPYFLSKGICYQNHAYFHALLHDSLEGRLAVFDLSDPQKPKWIGLFGQTANEMEQLWIEELKEDRLFITSTTAFNTYRGSYRHCLRCFDLSAPSSPLELTLESFVYQKSHRDYQSTLIASWVGDSRMLTLESTDIPLAARTTETQELYLFDISDPNDPQEIDRLEFTAGVNGPLTEIGDCILIPANEAGYYMVRKPNPGGSSVKEWMVY